MLIAIVSRESDRLNKLISDFLAYSRPQRFEFADVDLVDKPTPAAASRVLGFAANTGSFYSC